MNGDCNFDHLTGNIRVQYGHAHGNRITGATVLVLGPGDRVIRVVTIATVICTTASTTSPTSPGPSTQNSAPTRHSRLPQPRHRHRLPRQPPTVISSSTAPTTPRWPSGAAAASTASVPPTVKSQKFTRKCDCVCSECARQEREGMGFTLNTRAAPTAV